MSTLPVDLKDRAYNHSDFVGRGYVASFPSFLEDSSHTLLHPLDGYCTTSVPLLPALKTVVLTCSRNRGWAIGMSLVFQGLTSLQVFVLKVRAYNPETGELTGTITNIHAASSKRLLGGGLKSDTQWQITVPWVKTYDYNRNTGAELPIASGGLGARLTSESLDAQAALGMDHFGLATLKVEDDFLGMGEYLTPGQDGSNLFTIAGFERPESGDPFADWGMLKGTVAALSSVASIGSPVSLNSNPLRITTNANTDFMITTRIYISALGDGSNRARLTFGYAADPAGNTNRAGFRYDQGISPNWYYETMDGAVASQSASAVAVVAAAFIVLTMIKVAGTITFYVNGSSIGTKTTNFPAAGVHPFLYLEKTLGSSARYILCDYIRLNHRAGP